MTRYNHMQKLDGTKVTEEELKQWREEFYKQEEQRREWFSGFKKSQPIVDKLV